MVRAALGGPLSGATEPQRRRADESTEQVIGAAIEVHRCLGPGLLESINETAPCLELEDVNLPYQRQLPLPVLYKGRKLGEYRPDLLVADSVIVEIKSVERYDPVFQAQLLTYLRITGKTLGLLINFNSSLLTKGIRRFILNSSL